MLKGRINHPVRSAVVLGALTVALHAFSDQFATEALDRACGEVSYNPTGGSLVINDRVVLQVTDNSLRQTLLAEVMREPLDLCLLGRWLQRGQLFDAVDIAD